MLDAGLSCKDDLSLCPIFRNLSKPDRNFVLEHVRYEHLGTGCTLLREGDSQQGLHILVDGHCEVVKQLDGGSEQQLAILESGAIIGEVSFFSEAAHSATVRALEPTEAMCLSLESFRELRASRPEVAMTLIMNMGRLLAERFRRMDQYTYDLFARRETLQESHHRELYGQRFC